MQKKVLGVFIILVALGGGFYFADDIQQFFGDASREVATRIEQIERIPKEIITPEPLVGPTDKAPTAELTVSGILSETNRHRSAFGLAPLSLDTKLTKAAQIKVDDMFARQYFAHESPTGEGPGDLVEQVNYNYLSVAENLALGNYESDTTLVQAWMDSPGHRENILNPKFSDIGIAVEEGAYEGFATYMAVQEFGRPASECTEPSDTLNQTIEANQAELDRLEEEIESVREELERMRPKRGPAYERKVDEHNELVSEFNTLLEETKEHISTYNTQVEAYNTCIS